MGFIGSIGKTIKEVQELVKLNLVSCYFSLLFRETVNKAAHALAALECVLKGLIQFWTLFQTAFS
jgi:hypothetical protein